MQIYVYILVIINWESAIIDEYELVRLNQITDLHKMNVVQIY